MWKNPAPGQQNPLLKHKKALGQEPGILWWQSHGNMAHKQPKLCHADSSSCDSLPDLAVDFRYLWGWLCGCAQPDLGVHMGMRWWQRTTVVMSISTPNHASCLFKTHSNQALEEISVNRSFKDLFVTIWGFFLKRIERKSNRKELSLCFLI